MAVQPPPVDTTQAVHLTVSEQDQAMRARIEQMMRSGEIHLQQSANGAAQTAPQGKPFIVPKGQAFVDGDDNIVDINKVMRERKLEAVHVEPNGVDPVTRKDLFRVTDNADMPQWIVEQGRNFKPGDAIKVDIDVVDLRGEMGLRLALMAVAPEPAAPAPQPASQPAPQAAAPPEAPVAQAAAPQAAPASQSEAPVTPAARISTPADVDRAYGMAQIYVRQANAGPMSPEAVSAAVAQVATLGPAGQAMSVPLEQAMKTGAAAPRVELERVYRQQMEIVRPTTGTRPQPQLPGEQNNNMSDFRPSEPPAQMPQGPRAATPPAPAVAQTVAPEFMQARALAQRTVIMISNQPLGATAMAALETQMTKLDAKAGPELFKAIKTYNDKRTENPAAPYNDDEAAARKAIGAVRPEPIAAAPDARAPAAPTEERVYKPGASVAAVPPSQVVVPPDPANVARATVPPNPAEGSPAEAVTQLGRAMNFANRTMERLATNGPMAPETFARMKSNFEAMDPVTGPKFFEALQKANEAAFKGGGRIDFAALSKDIGTINSQRLNEIEKTLKKEPDGKPQAQVDELTDKPGKGETRMAFNDANYGRTVSPETIAGLRSDSPDFGPGFGIQGPSVQTHKI